MLFPTASYYCTADSSQHVFVVVDFLLTSNYYYCGFYYNEIIVFNIFMSIIPRIMIMAIINLSF